MKPIKVAVMGTAGDGFDFRLAGDALKASASALQELWDEASTTVEAHAVLEPLVTVDDARRAGELLGRESINFLILQTTAFASGEVAWELASYLKNLRIPVLIWGVTEPTGGVLRQNSLCCANFFASILNSRNVRYKWAFGAPACKDVKQAVAGSLQAIAVKENLTGSRLGLIGSGPVPGFYGSNFDHRVLKDRFGVTVQRVDLSTVFAKARSADEVKTRSAILRLVQGGALVALDETELLDSLRIYVALRDLAEEEGFSGLALRCWPEFPEQYGAAVCSSVALLNEDGIITSDESDVWGLVSLLASYYATGCRHVPTLLDMVSFNEERNSIGLWHCGATALCLSAEGQSVKIARHFNQQSKPEGPNLPSVCELIIGEGAATLSRFAGFGGEKLLLTSGELVASEPLFAGAWGELVLPVPVGDFVNTVMTEGIEHHFALAHSDHAPVLRELAYWLGIDLVRTVTQEEGTFGRIAGH